MAYLGFTLLGDRSRAQHRGGLRGFTMIELLVVISILMFLLGVVTAVFVRAAENAKKEAGRTLIRRVSLALARYQAELSELPPDSGFDLKPNNRDTKRVSNEVLCDPGSLWRYLSQEVVLRDKTGKVVRTYGPFTSFTPSELKEYKDSEYGKSFIVIDPWGTPLGYVGHPKRVVHNRGTFDVFSAGPNKVTGSTDGVDSDPKLDNESTVYSGSNDGSSEYMGEGILNGALTAARKKQKPGEVLDDLNNWDPE